MINELVQFVLKKFVEISIQNQMDEWLAGHDRYRVGQFVIQVEFTIESEMSELVLA